MVVEGFPSKLTALQFEWAWQKPEKTRHLRREVDSLTAPAPVPAPAPAPGSLPTTNTNTPSSKEPIFKPNAQRNWTSTKIAVARTLISRAPFRNLPLNVKIFTPGALEVWRDLDSVVTSRVAAASSSTTTLALEVEVEAGGTSRKATAKAKAKAKTVKVKAPKKQNKSLDYLNYIPPLPRECIVSFDPSGVNGNATEYDHLSPSRTGSLSRSMSTPTATAPFGTTIENARHANPIVWTRGGIDRDDSAFRNGQWSKWKRVVREHGGNDADDVNDEEKMDVRCYICQERVDVSVSAGREGRGPK